MKPFHTQKNREIFDGIVVVIILNLLDGSITAAEPGGLTQ